MKSSVHGFRSALAIVAAIIGGIAVAAGPLDDGMDAFHQKEYSKAAELWRPLAEGGDSGAQYLLATLYAEGKGVERNDATAFMWFQRAANHGDAAAQYNVGVSYASGTGVAKSNVDAVKWFRRAADQGVAFAQLNLGLLYASGNGVPQDNVEALKWFQLALFALPAGGPRSDVARAMTDVTEKMTRLEIDEARLRVREWKATPETR